MKTADLEGAALDWAVAKCEGHETAIAKGTGLVIIRRNNVTDYFDPSVNWGWGGPIIEREKLFLIPHRGHWSSRPYAGGDFTYGSTPLIAAMRCYVASKLGDEVEIPEELK